MFKPGSFRKDEHELQRGARVWSCVCVCMSRRMDTQWVCSSDLWCHRTLVWDAADLWRWSPDWCWLSGRLDGRGERNEPFITFKQERFLRLRSWWILSFMVTENRRAWMWMEWVELWQVEKEELEVKVGKQKTGEGKSKQPVLSKVRWVLGRAWRVRELPAAVGDKLHRWLGPSQRP